MRKITLKKLLSIILAFCIMLSSFAIVASAECAGHADDDGDTLCDSCGVQLVAMVTEGEEKTFYESINEAFEYANGKTAAITVLTDCDAGEATSSEQSPLKLTDGEITLYLNGHKITGKGYGRFGIISARENVVLTVEAGEYNYSYADDEFNSLFIAIEDGSITINGGNFIVTDSSESDIPNEFAHNHGGSLIINNTSISGCFAYGILFQYGGATVINNCRFIENNGDPAVIVYYDYNNGSVTINGGYYSSIYVSQAIDDTQDVVVADCIGEGYYAFDNDTNEYIAEQMDDGTYKYIENVHVLSPVALVNDTPYLDWQKAVADAVILESATVKLMQNVTHSEAVTLTGGNVTFDLNGNSITYIGTSSPAWDVQGGTHKITNGGSLKLGSYLYVINLADGAQLKISQATLPAGIGVSSGYNVLDVLSDGSYFMGSKGWTNSAKLEHVNSMAASDSLCIMPLECTNIPTEYSMHSDADESLTFEITDPTILSSKYNWYINNELVSSTESDTFILTGLSVGTYSIQCIAYSTQDESNPDELTFASNVCTLNVLPCENHIDNEDDSICDYCGTKLEAKVRVGDVNTWYESINEAFEYADGKTATIDIFDDCVATSNSSSPVLELTSGDITLNLNGNMITSSGKYDLIELDGAVKLTVEADGTEYEYNTNSHRRLFYVRTNATLVINGGKFKAISGASTVVASIVHNQGGSIILNDVTLSGKTSDGLLHQYSGNSVLNNCTFTADESRKAVDLYNDGYIEINGGYYSNIYVNTGSSDYTPFDLIGEGYYAVNNDTLEEITESQSVVLNSLYNYSYIDNVHVTKPVASVDENVYFDIQKAVDYAATLESATIKLLENVTHSDALTFNGGDITFDLNEKSVKYTGTGTTAWDIQSGKVFVINGGTVDVSVNTNSFNISDDAILNFESAHFPNGWSTSSNKYAVDILADGSFFYQDKWLTLTEDFNEITNMSGDVYVKKLQYTDIQSTVQSYRYYPNVLKFEVTDTSFETVKYQWYLNNSSIYNATSSTLDIGTLAAGVYQVSCVATCMEVDGESDPFTIKSNICTATVIDCDLHTDNNGDGICEQCQNVLAAKVVSGDVTNYFVKINDAVDYVNEVGGDITLILLNDIEHDDCLSFYNGNIIFDLNGKTLSYTVVGLPALGITNCTVNVINDGTIDMKNGTINIFENASLKIETAYFPNGYSIHDYYGVGDVTMIVADGSWLYENGWKNPKEYKDITTIENAVYIKPLRYIDLPKTMDIYEDNNNVFEFEITDESVTDVVYTWYVDGKLLLECNVADMNYIPTYEEGNNVITVQCIAEGRDVNGGDDLVLESTVCTVTIHECPHNSIVNDYCDDCHQYAQPDNVNGVYQITNRLELYWFADSINNGDISADSSAILLADIGTADSPVTRMIGTKEYPYCGTFDGNGYSIELNLVNTVSDNTGLISVVKYGAVLKNLTLNGSVSGVGSVGALVGADCYSTMGSFKISNCVNNATVIGSGDGIGGFIGQTYVSAPLFSMCINNGNVSGASYVGGYVGYVKTSGYTPNLTKCLNVGNVTATGNYAGGFIGCVIMQINSTYCGNVGNITANSYAAAFYCSEDVWSYVRYSYNIGEIIGATDGKYVVNSYDAPQFDYSYSIQEDANTEIGVTSLEEAENGILTYKLNVNDSEVPVWKQDIGVDAYPNFDGKYVEYNPNTNTYFNAAIKVNVIKDQIRFDTNEDGTYAGTFDYRILVQIDGVDDLCDSIEDIIDTSDGDGIIEAGFLFRKNHSLNTALSRMIVNGELPASDFNYSHVDNAYISTSMVPNGYTSACIVNNIPTSDISVVLSTIYYVKYVQDGVEISVMFDTAYDTTFEGLYNTYYPMAFPNT